ncbi:MAG: hypothetical protein HYS12_27425 [Planctomycetes bacterium]|nr:hypothetical protein [Planctomycetota bacterium]
MAFLLEEWLERVAQELNDLGQRKAISQAWFTDGCWNRYSWLHARVGGSLVRSVERPFIPMVEVIWHRGFKPDLCIVDERDVTVAVIEYESTNSSDERLFGKDLAHFENAIAHYASGKELLPEWWVILSTLPPCPVQNWPWWPDWNENTDYPPAVKDWPTRNRDPLAYYETGLHRELTAAWERVVAAFPSPPACKLVWVNLTPTMLKMMNSNGRPPAEPIEFSLKLPS